MLGAMTFGPTAFGAGTAPGGTVDRAAAIAFGNAWRLVTGQTWA
jgi:hypothetical protein